MAGEADVVVENFRPGVTERFGLDYESLRETNPGLIYCSITGFGAGEGATLAGYDLSGAGARRADEHHGRARR